MPYEIARSIVTFFPLQVYFAMSLFAFRFPKRSLFPLRYIASVALYTLATWFIPNILVVGWLDLKYIVILCIAAIFHFPCFRWNWKDALFCALAGYSVQHIGFSVMMICNVQFALTGWAYLAVYLSCFVAVYILCALLFARRLNPEESGNMHNSHLLLLVGITVCITQILLLWLNADSNLVREVLPRVYSIGGSLLVLIVQFNFFRETELEQKNLIIEQLMQQRNEQFAMSKENIDVINLKCHDLKKDLDLLLTVGDGAAREKLKQELSDSIMIYDSEVRTGNEAIDVLLMDRGIYCNKNNIKLSYIVDGKLLAFMDTADVFSLIGNMLDNAIEREVREEEGNRIITLRVVRRNGCIYVHTENYCSSPLRFAGGLPVTTKSDKTAHGYGTQSIRFVAEKYGGVVGMYSENDYFNVDVLFAFGN